MICARKIHDEFNILEGICKNIIFIVLWILIVIGQVVISQVGSYVFVCCKQGLTWQQWLIAFAVGQSSIWVNIVLKVIPDWLCPKLGQDSVDDRRRAKSKEKK